MIKDTIHIIVDKYGNKIKVIGGIFGLIAMVIAVKTFVNYSTIRAEEEKVKADIASMNQQISYYNNFFLKYQDSDYSNYFLAHKNNILFDREFIIKLDTTPSLEVVDEEIYGDNSINETPQESRKKFIKSKIN